MNEELIQEFKDKVTTAKFLFQYTCGTFMPNKRSYKILVVADDMILIDDNGIKNVEVNEDKTEKIRFFLNDHLEKFIEYSRFLNTFPNFKDSAKDEMLLCIEDESYYISNKVQNENINKFFSMLVKGIINITNL